MLHVTVRICEGVLMGSGKLQPDLVGKQVAAILLAALEKSDITQNRLSEISGVKITRLGDVLRRGRVITVTEVNSIAKALGLVGWQVMRTAESAVRAAEEDVREAGAELGVPADFRNDDDSHGDRGGGVRDNEGRDNDGNGGEEGSVERSRAGKGTASSRLAGRQNGRKGTR